MPASERDASDIHGDEQGEEARHANMHGSAAFEARDDRLIDARELLELPLLEAVVQAQATDRLAELQSDLVLCRSVPRVPVAHAPENRTTLGGRLFVLIGVGDQVGALVSRCRDGA